MKITGIIARQASIKVARGGLCRLSRARGAGGREHRAASSRPMPGSPGSARVARWAPTTCRPFPAGSGRPRADRPRADRSRPARDRASQRGDGQGASGTPLHQDRHRHGLLGHRRKIRRRAALQVARRHAERRAASAHRPFGGAGRGDGEDARRTPGPGLQPLSAKVGDDQDEDIDAAGADHRRSQARSGPSSPTPTGAGPCTARCACARGIAHCPQRPTSSSPATPTRNACWCAGRRRSP